MSSGNTNRANLPAAMLVFALLMFWQIAAMGMKICFLKIFPRGLGSSSKSFIRGSFLEIDVDDGAATQANTPGLV